MAHEHDEFFGYAADPAGAPPAPAPEPWASWPPIDVEGATAVARRSSVDPEMVMARHLAEGEGEPLVVTDAQRGWRARAEWDLEFLAKKYGDDDVIANDAAPLFVEDDPPMRTRRVKLREYIAYALGEQDNTLAREAARLRPPEVAAARANDEAAAPAAPAAYMHDADSAPRAAVWYMNSWEPFGQHADMRASFGFPYFVEDMLADEAAQSGDPADDADDAEAAEAARSTANYTKVFVGVPGCTTRLHFDAQQTHAWLSQVRGRKQFVLYPPSDAERLRLHGWEHATGCTRVYDPARPPEPLAYPGVARLRPRVAILGAGDTLLVPRGWWHYARALDANVTLMRNFANRANEAAFRDALSTHQVAAERCAPVGAPRGDTAAGTVARAARAVCAFALAEPSPGAKLLACAGCRRVAYLNKKNQRAHWPAHKRYCALLARLRGSSPRGGGGGGGEENGGNGGESAAMPFAKQVTRDGAGPRPRDACMVRVDYDGFLADGQKMDSTRDKREPLAFRLGRRGVVRGFQEAIMSMRVGERALVAVPPHAAYRERGVPNKVPPHTALVFDVELLECW